MAYPIYQTPQTMPPGLLAPEQSGFEGLLSNPLFNIGMGILASNRGNYGNAGAALSQGALLGLQQTQQQKQTAQLNKLRDIQLKNQTTESDTIKRQQDAITKFKQDFPALASAVDIDPKSAIKAAYPEINNNSAEPYFTIVATDKGLGAFNNRTGGFSLLPSTSGGALVKSTDSPLVRGAVKGAEAQAGAAWKPNTDIDGVVLTDEQVARMAHGNNPIPFSPQPETGLPTNNFNTPYPVTFGAPGTTATDRAEGVTSDASISLRNPSNPNVSGGIKVRTAAEQAADKTAAEEQAKFNSPEAVAKREKGLDFKRTMGGVVMDKIDNVIKRVDGFSAGFGGSLLAGVPGTDAYDLRADLDTIKANFGFDRLQAMRDLSPTGGALGQVAVQELSQLQASVANLDNAQSPAQLKANLQKAKTHYENWLKTLDGVNKEHNTSSSAPRVRKYNPKTGRIE